MESPHHEGRTIPESHSPIEKALLVAHFLEEDGLTDWALIIYELLSSFGDTVAKTRIADILSAPPFYKDVPRAKQLYRDACAAGYDAACHNLAVLFDQLGDSVSAQKYYALARARGAPDEADSLDE